MSSTDILENLSRLTQKEIKALMKLDPELFDRIQARIEVEDKKSEKEACEDSLVEFLIAGWQHIGEPEPLDLNWHHEVIAGYLEAQARGEFPNLVLNQPPRTTKAVSIGTPVLTTWGWKPHGDLVPGDFVFGADGQPKRVLAVTEHMYKPSSRLTFDEATTIIAADDHLWAVERDHPYGSETFHRCRKSEVLPTAELRSAAWCKSDDQFSNGRNKYRPDCIRIAAPPSLPPRRLLIDPYLLGAWLGDGSSTSATLYVGWQDIDHFRHLGSVTEHKGPRTERPVYHIVIPELQTKLRVLGILGNKHIPDDYLEASIEQRWELLRGLMDTDGCASTRDGVCSYVSKWLHLAMQVRTLVSSLGQKATLRETWSSADGKPCGPYYQVTFVSSENAPPIFRLERKQACVKRAQNTRSRRRYLQTVESVGDQWVNCIQVEGGLYVIGTTFLTTHNSLLCSVALPAWIWAQPKDRWNPRMGPHVQFFCLSYGTRLSDEIATKHRRLIQSDWYQSHWGHQVKLRDDQQNKSNFQIEAGGGRVSNSIEGGILGRGGIWQIVDDPHHTKGAESDIQRAETLDGMRALVTRVNNPKYAARTLVMQRLHKDDATNYALENWGRVKHLMFPMKLDILRQIPEDPRQEDGELLWPNRWDSVAVAAEETELGEYACTPAESPVLMADLTLKRIEDVCKGDEVVGFTTQHSHSAALEHGRPPRRKLVRATVTGTYRYASVPVFKIIMRSGAVIRCTEEHKWYQLSRGPTRPIYRQAKVGRKLARICHSSLPELTGDDLRLGGWLGGFFDGEGTVALSRKFGGDAGYRAAATINFYQGSGRNAPLCEKLEMVLGKFGFDWTVYEDERKDNKTAACYGYRCYRLAGTSLPLYQRFLHIAQPEKWRDRIIDGAYGAKFVREWDEILAIEPDGEEPVFALETTAGNYVVWGYASSNSAGQLQQSPVPRGGGVIKEDWWRLWPNDAEREAGNLIPYKCYHCRWEQGLPSQGSAVECPLCGAVAEVKIVYPDTSFRMLFVDTAYSEKDIERNSYNAITRWGVWHSKEDAPRAMLMQAWRGRVPLRGGTYDQRDPDIIRPEKGLVEVVHDMATQGEVDVVVIEKKTRGVDLNAELERLTRPWPYRIEFFEPTGRGDKVARLTSTTSLFTNDMVWAPGKQWARTVIEEVSSVPRAAHDDLADTVSGSLIYMRENGLLPLSYEFDAEKRRNALFMPQRGSVREMYEEA